MDKSLILKALKVKMYYPAGFRFQGTYLNTFMLNVMAVPTIRSNFMAHLH